MKKVLLLAYGYTAKAALESLVEKFNVVCIITPEQQTNIYRSSCHLPVEQFALSKSIKIIQSNKLLIIKEFLQKNKVDAIIISSYNKILPANILKQTKCINVHHGNLPKWRGRANINWAIIHGKKAIAITVHEAIPELDGGSIYKKFHIKITANDTIQTVYNKVNENIKKHLANVVQKVLDGYKGVSQKGTPSYCCTRLPEDGYIDWNQSTKQIHNLIRAITKPFDGAFSYLDGEKLVIWDSEIPRQPKIFEGRIPGRIIAIHKNKGVEVLTRDSSIIIRNVTFAGKETNASAIVKTVNKSFGISIPLLYEIFKLKSQSNTEKILS